MLNSRSAVAALVGVALCAGLEVATWKPLPVQATAAPGIISTYAGGAGSGTATTIPQSPSALVIRGSTVYIADYDHAVVRALNILTGNEAVVAGTGTCYYCNSPDGGQATATEIRQPTSIALDSAGNLFIGMNARVRRVDHSTGVITTVVGTDTAGFSGDGGPAAAAQVYAPQGLAFDTSDNLYIADASRIRKVDHSTGIITTIAGTGSSGFGGDGGPAISAGFDATQLAFDTGGNLFFADTSNNRIREIAGGIIHTVAGDGVVPYFGGDGGPATSAHLYNPGGVWVDGSGDLWITDSWHYRIREVVNGIINTVVGNGTYGSGGDGGPATSAQLFYPSEAVGDGAGNLFIADTDNKRLREVSSGIISTVAGNGTSCSRSGDGGPATAATLCSPSDVALDGAGDLFITDSANSVVREVSPAGVISTFAGDGTVGATGDGGPATAAKFWLPSGLLADGTGDVFIADSANNVVRKVTAGIITRFAGNYTAGLSGDGGLASSAELHDPSAIAIDSAGNIYIADAWNSRVRKVTPGGLISTYAGSTYGNSGDGGPATSAKLNTPTGLAVDSAGNLYIADGGNSNIRKVDAGGTISTFATLPNQTVDQLAVGPGDQVLSVGGNKVSVVTPAGPFPIVGDGGQGAAGDNGPALSAELNGASSATVDSGGTIFIADSGNQKIRRVQAFGLPLAPRSVGASLGFNYSATVRWAVPASSGGLPIISYTVTPSVGTPVTVTGSPPPLTATFSGLTPGSSYTFTVSAATAWGSSPDSGSTNVVTPVLIAPGGITTNAGSVGTGPATSLGQVPISVAWARGGNDLWVGDLGNPVVRDVNLAAGQEGVLAGNDSYGYSGNGGPATSAMVYGATAIADCGYDTYFADGFNYVIRKVDIRGVITTVAGTGVPGFSGDGGRGTSARIGRVFGLACRNGGADGIYISDSDNGRVRILTNNGLIYTWWYGFGFPTGITSTYQDIADVADTSGNRVWSLSNSKAVLLAGTGIAGSSGDNGPAVDAQLHAPRGLALEDGTNDLYIADELNNKIRVVDGTTGHIRTLAGSGTAGFADGTGTGAQFNEPTDVTIDPYDFTGNAALFVADTLNFRVRKVDRSSGSAVVSTVAGNGTPSLAGDGGPAISAQLGNPSAVAFDAAGNEYIADTQNSVIRKVATSGVISTVAGNGVSGYSGDAGLATAAELNFPQGLAVTAAGDIFISDTSNQRIRKVDHLSGNITTVAGNGFIGLVGDGGPGTSAEVSSPTALAVDGTGNLYIADTGNNRVRVLTPGGTINAFAGTGVPGYRGDTGPATTALLNAPVGLAIDTAGDVVIADTSNHRVRQVDAGTGIITSIAGTGVPGLSGDLHLATVARLAYPTGLAFDPVGNLYIADTGNQRIRAINTHGIISSVVGACGIVGAFSGDGGPADLGHINAPAGLATDAVGNVFIAEFNSNRVRTASAAPGARNDSCAGLAGTPGTRGVNSGPPTHPLGTRVSQGDPALLIPMPRRVPPASTVPARSAHVFPGHPTTRVTAPSRPRAGAVGSSGVQAVPEVPTGTKPVTKVQPTTSPQPVSPWYAALLVPIALLVVALVIQWRRQRE